ncbi:ABC transporter ATP-binding protein [Ectobacillus ponti]|uniref:ABC transporter ATP-binding protein n=1 Tax=Ectobacillus ponti TaxID=2961894 RepID=A0AA41XDP5_9BACI|nr:ABC transporter ATP-binding protein [Ectobacillus ponti]MCP8971010.1 ABC transporter ATP-binding protein [Ectobacillus ponti]
MIEVHGVIQSFGRKSVLQDVSLSVAKGEACALVGRNGAGKSTFIKTILGFLPPSAGIVQIGGEDVYRSKSWKKYVSYLPEKFQLYPQLTGLENLQFFIGSQADQGQLERELQAVGLWEARHERVHTYSKGMLQRLGLALMLCYNTDILILDEPTSGLDPIGRMEVLKILKSLEGKSILLTSHHLEEVRYLCQSIAYLEDTNLQKYEVDDFFRKVATGGMYA